MSIKVTTDVGRVPVEVVVRATIIGTEDAPEWRNDRPRRGAEVRFPALRVHGVEYGEAVCSFDSSGGFQQDGGGIGAARLHCTALYLHRSKGHDDATPVARSEYRQAACWAVLALVDADWLVADVERLRDTVERAAEEAQSAFDRLSAWQDRLAGAELALLESTRGDPVAS